MQESVRNSTLLVLGKNKNVDNYIYGIISISSIFRIYQSLRYPDQILIFRILELSLIIVAFVCLHHIHVTFFTNIVFKCNK